MINRPHILMSNSFSCLKKIFLSILLLMLVMEFSYAVERRRDQFGKDFGYFLFPLFVQIPGIGSASGAGASFLNLFESDLDLTAVRLSGDFEVEVTTILDLHLIPEFLILDATTYKYRVATTEYDRGLKSDKDEFVLPEMEGQSNLGQLTMSFAEREFEIFYRYERGQRNQIRVLDNDENEFPNINTDSYQVGMDQVGMILDLTDDRLDPRYGFRYEAMKTTPYNEDELVSDFYYVDQNATLYLPVPFVQWDTLVLNYFSSDATVTNQASTDVDELKKKLGLDCSNLTGTQKTECEATETKIINERIALNKYGEARALGGSQRLRGYPFRRFKAGHALYYGLEYRLNLSDEFSPFNILIAKGHRTGLQIAFYGEKGSVADKKEDLTKKMLTPTELASASFYLVLF